MNWHFHEEKWLRSLDNFSCWKRDVLSERTETDGRVVSAEIDFSDIVRDANDERKFGDNGRLDGSDEGVDGGLDNGDDDGVVVADFCIQRKQGFYERKPLRGLIEGSGILTLHCIQATKWPITC
jgi:hypothetical protein